MTLRIFTVLFLLHATRTVVGFEKVAEWYVDGTGNDASGNGNDLTVQSGVSFAPGSFVKDSIAKYDGGADACAHIPVNSDIHLNQPIMISLWLRTKGTGGSSSQAVFGWATAGSNPSIFLVVNGNTNRLDLSMYETGGTIASYINRGDDQWNHYAFYFDDTTDKLTSWLNGIKQTSISTYPNISPTHLTVGCTFNHGMVNTGNTMRPVSRLYGVTIHTGIYPCTGTGHFFFDGKCHWFAGTDVFDKNKCVPDGELVSVHNAWDDLFYSQASPTAGFWIGISAPGPRSNLTAAASNWEWVDGTPMDYTPIWCGDARHRQNQWFAVGGDCESSVQPNKVTTTCARYEHNDGPGLLDFDCNTPFNHLCYRWAFPQTLVPDTDAPATAVPTDAPATGAPATGVPATDAPATGAPATGAPATGAPATGAPATGAPATGAPATGAPATGAPATGAPATGAPTTGAPATGAPATGAPTTGAPATGAPTTGAPATGAPATGAPATGAPATGAPSTGAPATGAPATGAPATGAPTTGAPATGAPATGAPTTGAPTTGAPATGAPATGAPATGAPATGAPATGAPATGAPATGAPATGAPATGAPTTGAPATGAPTTGAPATGAPTTGAPATGAPATGAPATGAPATGAPATGAPATGAPTTGAPATGAPATGAPATGAPATGAPATGAPTTGAPATGAPATGAPATGAPATGAPATGAPATGAPATRAPTTGAPATGAPATRAPATGAPATGAPATGAPATGAPATGAPATGAPATGAPATGAPSTDAPATGAPTDSPATEAPATDAPATGAPATPVPNTLVPTTSAPKTLVPITPVPRTQAPATQAPATSEPTQAPSTFAPPTAQPTSAPATLPPVTALPTAAPQTTAPSPEPTTLYYKVHVKQRHSTAQVNNETASIVLELENANWRTDLKVGTEEDADIVLKPGSAKLQFGKPVINDKGQLVISVWSSEDLSLKSSTSVAVHVKASATNSVGEPIDVKYHIDAVPTVDQDEKNKFTAISSIGGTGSGKTGALLHLLECPVEVTGADLTRTENIFHLSLGDYRQPLFAGAVLGNSIFVAMVVGFHFLVSYALYVYRRRSDAKASFLAAASTCRFPSYSFLPAMFFYQTTLESGMHLLVHEPQFSGKLLALMCIVLYNGSVVGLVYHVVRPSVFQGDFVKYDPPTSMCGKMMQILVGVGDYGSQKDATYVWRYGLLFHDFWPRAYRFMLVEVGFVTALALVDGIEAKSDLMCRVQLFTVLLLYLVYLCILIFRRPYHSVANNFASISTAVLQTLAVLFIVIHLYGTSPQSTASRLAVYCLYGSLGTMILKTVLEISSACFDNYMQAKEHAEQGSVKELQNSDAGYSEELLEAHPVQEFLDFENAVESPGSDSLSLKRLTPRPFESGLDSSQHSSSKISRNHGETSMHSIDFSSSGRGRPSIPSRSRGPNSSDLCAPILV